MEGLIIVAILYFVFRAVTQKSKVESDAKAKQDAAAMNNAQRRAQKPSPQNARAEEKFAREDTPLQKTAFTKMTANREYQTIQPTVQVSRKLDANYGSLGAATQEGTASDEGESTAGNRDANNLLSKAVRAETAEYRTGEQAQTVTGILPESWNGNAIVQAVVMNEILNRPRRWR